MNGEISRWLLCSQKGSGMKYRPGGYFYLLLNCKVCPSSVQESGYVEPLLATLYQFFKINMLDIHGLFNHMYSFRSRASSHQDTRTVAEC